MKMSLCSMKGNGKGMEKPHDSEQAGSLLAGKQLCRKDLQGPVGNQVEHESTKCACGKGQQAPGLH